MESNEEIRLQILSAYDNLKKSKLYVRTNIEDLSNLFHQIGIVSHNFYVKNETTQESGSFKFRGVLNQFKNLLKNEKDLNTVKLITFSAGNYGRSFAKMCSTMGIKAVVIMPDFAPDERASFIESLGILTEKHTTEKLPLALESYMKDKNNICFHPFDDINLIYGHASFGLEILEDFSNMDVVLVPCGGGGILAGTAITMKLFGNRKCKIYGIEPETANTMKMSFEKGFASSKIDAKSVASGLSPPSAGKLTYEICRKYVDDVFLVTETEILAAMVKLHEWGIKAEPSGSAAVAAVLFNKIPILVETKSKLNVLIAVTGGNCSVWDLEYVKSHI